MPIITNLRSFELRNQLRNGDSFVGSTSEFATNFVGAVGETLQATYQIDLSWFAEATPGDAWELEALAIERQIGSFVDDGFAVGQTFEYFSTWATYNSTSEDFVGEITAITLNGRRIEFTVSSGSVTPTSAITTAGIQCQVNDPDNMPDAAILRFNVLPNGQSFSNISELTQTGQSWYAANIDVVGSTTETMYPVGVNQGWKTGSATIERNLANLIKNGATYEIVHTFQVAPFFTVDYLNDLQNGTTPALWQQELNYYFEIEFRDGLNNTNSAKFVRPDRPLGASSWFNQSPGGFFSRYTIATGPTHTDTTTSDPVDSIQVDARTTTTFTITRLGVPGSSAGFNASERAIVYIAYLPELQSEYQQTPTDLEANFIFDQITGVDGLAPTTGTGVFKECEVSVAGGVMTVTVQTEYSSAEQVKIGADSSYMLWVMVGDTSVPVNDSDRTPVLVEVGDYTRQVFIPNLASFQSFNLLTHERELNTDAGADPTKLINAWPEDGVLIDFELQLDTTKQAAIDSITFLLTAYKADGTYFELDSYEYDISNGVTSGGVQQFNIDDTRGYILRVGDQFNLVELDTAAAGAGTQNYTGVFAQKANWQDWLFNAAVDPVFYDASQPQNNLNFKSDNYSDLNDYEIRILAIVDLTGVDANGIAGVGRLIQTSAELDMFDYDVSDDGTWTGTIQTLDPDTLADLGQTIRSDKDTLFRVVWTNPSTDLSQVYAIHRIQGFDSIGEDIEELSSLRLPSSTGNEKLKPTTGNTLLDVSVSGSDIHSECLIDHTNLTPGTTYNLSARIERYPLEPEFTVSYVGCDMEITNTYSGGGITNIEYQFSVGGTIVDTINTTLTTYTWDKASLYNGETVSIQQTITAGGTIVTGDTTAVSVAATCYFEFTSDLPGASTFDPSLTATSGSGYWRLPDDVVRTGFSQSGLGSSFGFDGTDQIVRFRATDFSAITDMDINGLNVKGALDISVVCQQADNIRYFGNSGITSVVNPSANTANITFYRGYNCGIIGSVDMSGFSGLGGTFEMYNNPGLTSIIHTASSVNLSRYDVSNCDITGTLDVSGLNLSGYFDASDNANMLALSLPTNSNTFSVFYLEDVGISGTVALSTLTGLGGQVRIRGAAITTVTFPASSQAFAQIFVRDSGLLNTIDLSPILGTISDINIKGNLGLTDVLFPSVAISIFDAFDCALGVIPYNTATLSGTFQTNVRDNAMSAAEINESLVNLDTALPGGGSGVLTLDGTNAAPDGTSGGFDGLTAKSNLQGKGYTVNTT